MKECGFNVKKVGGGITLRKLTDSGEGIYNTGLGYLSYVNGNGVYPIYVNPELPEVCLLKKMTSYGVTRNEKIMKLELEDISKLVSKYYQKIHGEIKDYNNEIDLVNFGNGKVLALNFADLSKLTSEEHGEIIKMIKVHNKAIDVIDLKSEKTFESPLDVGRYLYSIGAFPFGIPEIEKEMKKISSEPKEENPLAKLIPIL